MGKENSRSLTNLNRPPQKVNETLRQIFVRFCGLSAVPASIEVGSGWARVVPDHGQAARGGGNQTGPVRRNGIFLVCVKLGAAEGYSAGSLRFDPPLPAEPEHGGRLRYGLCLLKNSASADMILLRLLWGHEFSFLFPLND